MVFDDGEMEGCSSEKGFHGVGIRAAGEECLDGRGLAFCCGEVECGPLVFILGPNVDGTLRKEGGDDVGTVVLNRDLQGSSPF